MTPLQKQAALIDTPLWKIAIRFMLSFAFILIIAVTAIELFRNGNLNAITLSFKDGSWLGFLITRTAIIVGYGFVMAFLTKNKAKNRR